MLSRAWEQKEGHFVLKTCTDCAFQRHSGPPITEQINQIAVQIQHLPLEAREIMAFTYLF